MTKGIKKIRALEINREFLTFVLQYGKWKDFELLVL